MTAWNRDKGQIKVAVEQERERMEMSTKLRLEQRKERRKKLNEMKAEQKRREEELAAAREAAEMKRVEEEAAKREAELVARSEAEWERRLAARRGEFEATVAKRKQAGTVTATELVALKSKFAKRTKAERKALLEAREAKLGRLRKTRAAAREARMRQLGANQRQARSAEEAGAARAMEEARLADAKEREQAVLKGLAADIPSEHCDDAVRLILQPRHNQEVASMMATHLREMCGAKGAAHARVRKQKASELAELLTALDYNNADAETIDQAVSELRVKFERVADEAKRVATEALEVRRLRLSLLSSSRAADSALTPPSFFLPPSLPHRAHARCGTPKRSSNCSART